MTSFRLPADDLEYAVLALLWELHSASIRVLHEQLGAPVGNAYTTTAKVVDRLRDKGLVTRLREGGTYVYSPAIEQQKVDRVRARQLLGRFLGPDPHTAVAALVDAVGDIDPKLLEELEQATRRKKKESKRGA